MRMETILFSHCRRYPDKEALILGDRRVTYREFGDRVTSIAKALIARGIKPGDRVVLYLPNCIEFAEGMFGVLAAGAIAVPVTTRLTLSELTFFCNDCDAKVVVCDSERADAIAQDIVGKRTGMLGFSIGGAFGGLEDFATLRLENDWPLPSLPLAQDEAAILYTSGTTGQPKGVVITHANLLIQHGFMNGCEWGIGADDRYLVVTPMAHRAGMGRLVNSTMLGGTLCIIPQFDAEEIISTIEREKITVFGMVPTVCRMLMPAIESHPERCYSLRRIAVTGEAFPVALKKRLIAALPDARLVSFFGMTEAGGVTYLSHEEQFTHPEAVGRPSPGVEVRIVSDAGKDVALGEVGELLVRTGAPGAVTVMKEYFNRPEQTAAALRDGWFYTGDMAREDADGYIYIADRKKDMIVSGGFNVYSKEVEQVISEVAGVRDAAVVGIPDDMYGEAVVAFVERSSEGQSPDEKAIVEHCRIKIAGYKKPRHVFFIETLPRNATGKVVKHLLVKDAITALTRSA
ncbi:MAG: AMP-dependent synthetase [Afipia sp. 62-7]|nr:AMP-binding protein [Afipia sp.]OJU19921.1 MAG: AMP-dependent synthetase [Afipia sp. 62-7]